MTEDTQLPVRQHTRVKSTTSDIENDHKESSTRPRLSRTPSKKKSESSISDDATVTFVRRILCGHQIRLGVANEGGKTNTLPSPLEELLPPLTSSNKMDLQLYALVAIIIKDFVQIWYSKITPDQQFADEVIQIIAHCTRGLEQRIRHIDLETLLFDEIPAVLDAHITAYRTSYGGLYTSSLGTDPRNLYHAIHPHPALSPLPSELDPSLASEQIANERVWRQLLIQAALSLLLPPEDLENPCLTVLVADILSELIIGNALCGKPCEGWFIWEIIIKFIELASPVATEEIELAKPTPVPSRLEQFGLLSDDQPGEASLSETSQPGPAEFLFLAVWQVLRYSTMLFSGLRTIVTLFSSSAGLPSRTNPHPPGRPSLSVTKRTLEEPLSGLSQPSVERPILGMSAWSCCSHLFSLDLRMPWLISLCEFIQWFLIYGPGRVGYTNSKLDRLLSHHITTMILNPDRLPSLLLIIRTNVFPNNSLGPGRVPPTKEEALEIKRRCASTIIDALPRLVLSKLFTDQDVDDIQNQVEEMLDVFSDTYLNKHVVFALVDLIFSRLFPEIQEQDISALLHSR